MRGSPISPKATALNFPKFASDRLGLVDNPSQRVPRALARTSKTKRRRWMMNRSMNVKSLALAIAVGGILALSGSEAKAQGARVDRPTYFSGRRELLPRRRMGAVPAVQSVPVPMPAALSVPPTVPAALSAAFPVPRWWMPSQRRLSFRRLGEGDSPAAGGAWGSPAAGGGYGGMRIRQAVTPGSVIRAGHLMARTDAPSRAGSEPRGRRGVILLD